MGFLKRLFGRNADTNYKYRGTKLPTEPLTPREIEEMHKKLHPETHVNNAALPKEQKPIFDSWDWSVSYTQSLEEKFSAASADVSLQKAQSKSLLFSRLPPEVRTQIWCHVVGNHKLHLTVHRGRLRQSALESSNYQWWPQMGLLRVPLICRAAYVCSLN